MASKSKRLRQNTEFLNKTIKRIGYLSVLVFLVKLLIIWRITNLEISQVQGHIWLGADGENYLKGVDSLVKDGLFSKAEILSYWPAGYPILIYILSFFGNSWALTLLAIAQTLLFSVVSYLFAKELFQSRLRKFTFIIFVLISFNPTLSLNSMVVGYESFAASLLILALTLILRIYRVRDRNQTILAVLVSSFSMFVLTFMQPRFLLTAPLVLFGLIYLRFKNNLKRAVMVFIVSTLIVAIAPISLIIRNHVATNLNVISTNLGNTMAIGAGETKGGYKIIQNGKWVTPTGISCDKRSANIAEADRYLTLCVLDWYFNNPKKALVLFFNKSVLFWSPWIDNQFLPGVVNGTMARNPWLTIHPLKNMTKTQDGINLLYSSFGKFIAWLWVLSGLLLVFYGFLMLWRQKFEVRLIAVIAGVIVLTSWLVTLISIGDHRFRLPIMGASLFLQAVGIRTLFAGGKPPMVQPADLR